MVAIIQCRMTLFGTIWPCLVLSFAVTRGSPSPLYTYLWYWLCQKYKLTGSYLIQVFVVCKLKGKRLWILIDLLQTLEIITQQNNKTKPWKTMLSLNLVGCTSGRKFSQFDLKLSKCLMVMTSSGGKFLHASLKLILFLSFVNSSHYLLEMIYTVVWEKFIVENIHAKIIRCKKFSSLLASDENLLWWNFLPLNFFEFKLVTVSVGKEAITH